MIDPGGEKNSCDLSGDGDLADGFSEGYAKGLACALGQGGQGISCYLVVATQVKVGKTAGSKGLEGQANIGYLEGGYNTPFSTQAHFGTNRDWVW